MKTNIQVLLSKIEKKEKLPNVFFLFGNDQGIISGMVSAVYNYHKKNNEVELLARNGESSSNPIDDIKKILDFFKD